MKINLGMAILNINQFIERPEIRLTLCPRCSGNMCNTGISVGDAMRVLFANSKIKGRLKCNDCKHEIRVMEK